MFEKFYQDKIDFPGQEDIKFFDESMIEKINRSSMVLSKTPTPFLSDTRY